MIFAYILFFTFLGSIVSLIGSFLLLVKKRLTESFSDKIVNFAAGVLIATAFLDLIPEADKAAGQNNTFLPVLAGFVAFFFAERFIQRFHKHHEHGPKTTVPLILLGDGVHNFIDGVAIAVSFLTSIPLGIATTFAVAAHEVPQEIADMAVLLAAGLGKSKALLYNFLSALSALAGATIAYFFAPLIMANLYVFLALTGGFFIYISASDLIPALHEKYLENRQFSYTFIFVFGIISVYLLSLLFEG